MEIASTTLKALEDGSYELDGTVYDLKESTDQMKKGTILYPANSELSEWNGSRREKVEADDARPCEMLVLEISALDGGRLLKNVLADAGEQGRIGMLNFASAKHPGGGFLNGAQAQVCVRNFLKKIANSGTGRIHCTIVYDLWEFDDGYRSEILPDASEGSKGRVLQSCDNLVASCPSRAERRRRLASSRRDRDAHVVCCQCWGCTTQDT